MRTNSISRVREELVTVQNRAGQLVNDLTELGLELTSLGTAAAALVERARTFESPRQRDGLRIIDPAADTSDPRETLAVLKERLRRTEENFARAAELLEQRREKIRSIVG
jgi:hypothetical protein